MNEFTRGDYHFNRWTQIVDGFFGDTINMFCVQAPTAGAFLRGHEYLDPETRKPLSGSFKTILSFKFSSTAELNLFWNQFNDAVHQCDQVTDRMNMRDIYDCILKASIGISQKSREQIIDKLEYLV